MGEKLWLKLNVNDLEKETYKVHLKANVSNENALYVLLKVAYMFSENNDKLIQNMIDHIKEETVKKLN